MFEGASRAGSRLGRLPASTRLVLLLGVLALPTTHWAPGSWNDLSRMATIQSVVESHTLVIDRSPFNHTGDKVFIRGHFYSDKPPVPSLIGAAVYLPLHAVGIRLHRGRSLAYFLITLLTVKLAWLLGALAFFGALRSTGLTEGRRLLAALALGVGSLYLSYSSTFNNHVPAAAFLSGGLYFLLTARGGGAVRRNLAGAGLSLALAGACDTPMLLFVVLFAAYVLADRCLRAGFVAYALPAAVVVAGTLALNYAIHGSVMPVQLTSSYFVYPGSPWIDSPALSGTHLNGPRDAASYAVRMFAGKGGFLLYNPLLIVALVGLVGAIRRRGALYAEAVVVGSGSAVVIAYYVLTTTNFGGFSYSIRWLVPLLPLLFLFLAPALAATGDRRPTRFLWLLGVSVVIALVGTIDPWSNLHLSTVPFLANLRELLGR